MPYLARFIERQHPDPDHAVDRFAQGLLGVDPRRDTWEFLKRLNAAIRQDFAYLRRDEAGIQDPTTTLRRRSGTCRDFAALMCEAVRSQGLAARFVSGHLYVSAQNEPERNAGGATHAWLQVYLPGGGWIDFDPTSGSVGNRDLVRIAAVRNPAHASPVSGTFLGFPSDFLGMTVDIDVRLETGDRAEANGPASVAA
jgi:transglutaminase-like putative cysteine protease